MNLQTELQVAALIENVLSKAFEREMEEDSLASFNSRKMTNFVITILFPIFAQPIATDAYQCFKKLVTDEVESIGIHMTEEESKTIFNETYKILALKGEIDESWKSYTPYEK